MILYHITDKNNLPRIKKEGLKLRYNKIFLSQDPYFWQGIFNAEGKGHYDNFSILKVNVAYKNLKVTQILDNCIIEAQYFKPIKKLEVIKCGT